MIYLKMSALPFNYYLLLFSNWMFSVGNQWEHLLLMEPEMASPDKKGLPPPGFPRDLWRKLGWAGTLDRGRNRAQLCACSVVTRLHHSAPGNTPGSKSLYTAQRRQLEIACHGVRP